MGTADRAAARARSVPGDLLLGLVPLVAIVVLLVNDHALKAAWPGVVTGKLSDVAGLVFFPLLLVGAWELVVGRIRRAPEPGGLVPVAWALAIAGVGFTLVKLSPVVGEAYRLGLGFVQWPVVALARLATGDSPPAIGLRASLVADPTDLVALPALAVPLAIALVSRGAVGGLRERTRDGIVAGLALGMLGGAILDGWAHTHEPAALETVLSPWHAVVYTSFALLVAVVGSDATLRARAPASPSSSGSPRVIDEVRRLIVPGYGWLTVGAVVFVASGLADTAWHVAFGLEADAEALVSPTHLLLGVGAGMVAMGPVRAIWLRREAATWPAFLPAVIGLATLVGLTAFATHLASPYVDPWPLVPYDPGSASRWAVASVGIASVALQSAIVAGGVAVLLRLWPAAPTGAILLIVGIGVGPLAFLHDQARLVLASLLTGVTAEVVLAMVRSRRSGEATTRLLAMLVPAMLWTDSVVVLAMTSTVAWSAHLIGGAFVVAAMTGLLVGVLATLPMAPGDPGT